MIRRPRQTNELFSRKARVRTETLEGRFQSRGETEVLVIRAVGVSTWPPSLRTAECREKRSGALSFESRSGRVAVPNGGIASGKRKGRHSTGKKKKVPTSRPFRERGLKIAKSRQ